MTESANVTDAPFTFPSRSGAAVKALLLREEVVEVSLTAAEAELATDAAVRVKRPAREGAATGARLHLLTTRVCGARVTSQVRSQVRSQVI